MSILVAVTPAEGHLQCLAELVQRRQDEAGHVTLVSAEYSWEALQKAFQAAGVDEDRVYVLDAVPPLEGAPEPRPGVMFLQSPTMLELIAMRTEQVAVREVPSHVILDNVNAFVGHNRLGPVLDFTKYLVNRLHSLQFSGDLMVIANDAGAEIEQAIAPFTDGRLDL